MTLKREARQNNSNQALPAGKEYAVNKFHTPRVAIVIPHYNYSAFIGDALLSVQQQTYTNFNCVIVDDCSTEAHFGVASQAVAKLADGRFKLVRNAENLGQIPSIYRGIDEVDAAFLAVLDPDDRYAPEFISRMLAVHLSPLVFCPLVACDQHLLKIGDGIITATLKAIGLDLMASGAAETERQLFTEFGFHRYVPPTEAGWPWTTTSAMLFRTEAVKLIRPNRKLEYRGHADAYLANGSHMLGGTMLLRQPLVYRGLHSENDFIAQSVFSMFQKKGKPNAVFRSDMARRDVIEAFLANGGLEWFSVENLRGVIQAQFSGPEFDLLLADVPGVAEIFAEKV